MDRQASAGGQTGDGGGGTGETNQKAPHKSSTLVSRSGALWVDLRVVFGGRIDKKTQW